MNMSFGFYGIVFLENGSTKIHANSPEPMNNNCRKNESHDNDAVDRFVGET